LIAAVDLDDLGMEWQRKHKKQASEAAKDRNERAIHGN
jgi:hypothetical protein